MVHDVTLLRDQEGRLLLDISAVVAEIRQAPATTLLDHLALLDVAIEHEIDLVADIAYYGARDFPMITRLLRALARTVPGFEFNSLRRWLSSPDQFEQLMEDDIGAGGPFAGPILSTMGTFRVTVVPEPSSAIALIAALGVGVAVVRRRR